MKRCLLILLQNSFLSIVYNIFIAKRDVVFLSAELDSADRRTEPPGDFCLECVFFMDWCSLSAKRFFNALVLPAFFLISEYFGASLFRHAYTKFTIGDNDCFSGIKVGELIYAVRSERINGVCAIP